MDQSATTRHEDRSDQPIVRCRSVTKRYSRGRSGGWFGEASGPSVTALEDVTVSVERGELVGVSGPSGSGKSTLLHLLAGLDTPTSGSVEIDGTAIEELSERRRARLRLTEVGIVFQRFYLLPSLSARANVALPLIERGIAKSTRRARAESLLEEMGLGDRITHKPGELSGGEQQRVAIARALANDPTVLLADEPTGELDSEAGAQIIRQFRESAGDRAVIMASHDEEAIAAADTVIRLRDGRLRNEP